MAKQQSQTNQSTSTPTATPEEPSFDLQDLLGNGFLQQLLQGTADDEYDAEVPEAADQSPLPKVVPAPPLPGPRREQLPVPESPAPRDPRLTIPFLRNIPLAGPALEDLINDWMFDPTGTESPKPAAIPTAPGDEPGRCQTTVDPKGCQDGSPTVVPSPPIPY